MVRRHADLEPLELNMRNVLAPETRHGGVDGEAFDGDQWRNVGAPVLPDDEVFAFGAKAGKDAQLQVAQLNRAVEPF